MAETQKLGRKAQETLEKEKGAAVKAEAERRKVSEELDRAKKEAEKAKQELKTMQVWEQEVARFLQALSLLFLRRSLLRSAKKQRKSWKKWSKISRRRWTSKAKITA